MDFFSPFVFVAFAQKQKWVLLKVLLITEKLKPLNYGTTQTTLNYIFFLFFYCMLREKVANFKLYVQSYAKM